MLWFFFLGLLSALPSVASAPTMTWDDIRCTVTIFDCSQNSNSTWEFIAGQCYASYSPMYGGAAWMMSADCSQVTVASYGNGSRTGCSVAGGKAYSTINPTTCIPGLAGNMQGGKFYATKKTVPAPSVPSSLLCASIVAQYTGSTTCSASQWSSTLINPFARGICISFTGTTGSSMSSSDCLSYSLYSTNDCSGTTTATSEWGQGCRLDGATNSVFATYGLPGIQANPPGSPQPPPPTNGSWKPADGSNSGALRGGWLSTALVLSVMGLAIGFLC